MEAMVAMFNTGDLSDVEAAVHTDYVDHQGLDGEPVQGVAGFARVVFAARGRYQSLRVTIEALIEESERVAARLRWQGVRISGEVVDRETLEIVRIEGGKAVEHWGGRS